jgi:hypothetical protein
MNELTEAARIVATVADMAAPALVRDGKVPSVTTITKAQEVIERIVTQDPPLESKRVWATVFGVVGMIMGGLAAALMMPEAKEVVGPSAPMLAAIIGSIASGLGGGAALVSKATDQRPTR